MWSGLSWRLSGAVGLMAALPMILAWLSAQSLLFWGDPGVNNAGASPVPFELLLLWGPLVETVLLLLAARAVMCTMASKSTQHSASLAHDRRFGACGAIIGLAFVGSHLIQNGVAALASLPMGLLLVAGAVRAAHRPTKPMFIVYGPGLFVMHVEYNAVVLALGRGIG